ncbi:hypothetical protein [Xanthobacter sediminis]
MLLHASSRLSRASAAIRSAARLRASVLVACGMAAIPAAIPVAPAAAQYLTYERPYVYERPPVYVPGPRGPLRYVMLPPAEVRRRLQAMGYWQISRPELMGRVYSVTAVDDEGLASLQVDAYSGEVLGARPLPALPPGAGRPPVVVPPARVTAPRPTVSVSPMAPRAPLPPVRPPEAGYAGPVSPAAMPSVAPAEPPPVAVAPAAPPAASDAPATQPASPPAVDASASPAPPPAAAAPAPAEPAPPTSAGSATPGSSGAGSASVLSRPPGTD